MAANAVLVLARRELHNAADQVGQEVGRAEEADPLELGGTQKGEEEGHHIDQDHVEDDKEEGDEQRPDEAGLAEHGGIVGETDHLGEDNAVPVGEGVEQADKERDDDGDREGEEQREEEDDVNHGPVLLHRGVEVQAAQNEQRAYDEEHAAQDYTGIIFQDYAAGKLEHAHDQARDGQRFLCGGCLHRYRPFLLIWIAGGGRGRLRAAVGQVKIKSPRR